MSATRRQAQWTVGASEDTRALGERLANALRFAPQDRPIVIFLSGELGAGKTTLASGLLQRLGVAGPVRSPTYTLIEPYELDACTLYHLDLYRLAAAGELDMLALRDLLQPGAVLLIEWAEKGAGALPPADLAIHLQYPATHTGDENEIGRRIAAKAYSDVGELLLNKMLEDAS